MRKTEQRLWDRFRANAPRDVRLERVENIATVGMPDIIALHRCRVSWIELKAVEDLPARAATPVLGNAKGVSAEQRNWHHSWQMHGGSTFILVGIGSEQLLMPGSLVAQINSMSFPELAAACVATTWHDVYDAIRRGTD